jgi:hypothetical protein
MAQPFPTSVRPGSYAKAAPGQAGLPTACAGVAKNASDQSIEPSRRRQCAVPVEGQRGRFPARFGSYSGNGGAFPSGNPTWNTLSVLAISV